MKELHLFSSTPFQSVLMKNLRESNNKHFYYFIQTSENITIIVIGIVNCFTDYY